MEEFDYYIYIDYSENLIGYNIIKKDRIKEFLVIDNLLNIERRKQ